MSTAFDAARLAIEKNPPAPPRVITPSQPQLARSQASTASYIFPTAATSMTWRCPRGGRFLATLPR